MAVDMARGIVDYFHRHRTWKLGLETVEHGAYISAHFDYIEAALHHHADSDRCLSVFQHHCLRRRFQGASYGEQIPDVNRLTRFGGKVDYRVFNVLYGFIGPGRLHAILKTIGLNRPSWNSQVVHFQCFCDFDRRDSESAHLSLGAFHVDHLRDFAVDRHLTDRLHGLDLGLELVGQIGEHAGLGARKCNYHPGGVSEFVPYVRAHYIFGEIALGGGHD
jgi:hypothetical protein